MNNAKLSGAIVNVNGIINATNSLGQSSHSIVYGAGSGSFNVTLTGYDTTDDTYFDIVENKDGKMSLFVGLSPAQVSKKIYFMAKECKVHFSLLETSISKRASGAQLGFKFGYRFKFRSPWS